MKNQNVAESDLVEYIRSSIEVIIAIKVEERDLKESCQDSF